MEFFHKFDTQLYFKKLSEKRPELTHISLVKESKIPLDVIFNKEINKIKDEDRELQRHPKPIYFKYYDKGPQMGKGNMKVTISLHILVPNLLIIMQFLSINFNSLPNFTCSVISKRKHFEKM